MGKMKSGGIEPSVNIKNLGKKKEFPGHLQKIKQQNKKRKKRGVRSSKLPIPYKQHPKGKENKSPCERHKNKMKMEFGAHHLLQLKVELQKLMIKKT